MSERRFDRLHGELLRSGVAARHVRRAVTELAAHFEQLVDDGVSAGRSTVQARAEAHETLGTDAALIARFASRPELRAWPCRAPVWFFGVAPLVSIAALQLAVGFSVAGLMGLFSSYFSRLSVTREVSSEIGSIGRVLMLWCFPILVSAAFARIAYRHRLPFRWPLLAVGVVCTLAGLSNFEFELTGGTPAGQIGLGVGISPESLAGAGLHALAAATFVLVPMLFAFRSTRRRRSA